ncbi:hypothetical protein L210DRAFT_3627285 [Boletus edulis BED1]|uniref:Uncharacterized protein n=1 Tax=Boletus edulis BED1 TaxID=1328754 RepID=A0AAD4C815_BOLED|nr:hypothetical protein L210DRAFT_3627285 [Boletus edulis BED1]
MYGVRVRTKSVVIVADHSPRGWYKYYDKDATNHAILLNSTLAKHTRAYKFGLGIRWWLSNVTALTCERARVMGSATCEPFGSGWWVKRAIGLNLTRERACVYYSPPRPGNEPTDPIRHTTCTPSRLGNGNESNGTGDFDVTMTQRAPLDVPQLDNKPMGSIGRTVYRSVHHPEATTS